jgi:hypothetical protein
MNKLSEFGCNFLVQYPIPSLMIGLGFCLIVISFVDKTEWFNITDSEKLRQRGFKFGSGLIASGFLLLVLSSTPIKQSQCTPSNPTPTSTPSPTPTSTPTPTITTSEAVDLIEKYLAAKNNMLGKNYITSDAEKYTTDKLYEELLSSSYPTSITWLKKNNAYYQFEYETVIKHEDVSRIGNDPAIRVTISGKYNYFSNNKLLVVFQICCKIKD